MPASSSEPTPKQKPEIKGDIDIPFSIPENCENNSSASGECPPSDPRYIEVENQKHRHRVQDFKNTVGRNLLYGCLIIIAIFAIADAHFKISSQLFSNAFDIFKIIATTILGYMFGNNSNEE